MTDEELGRKFADANGNRPMQRHLSGGYKPWAWESMWRGWPCELPAEVLEAVRQTGGHWAETPGGASSCLSYDTEGEAYTALGASIRRVLAFADQVRDDLGLNKSTEVTS